MSNKKGASAKIIPGVLVLLALYLATLLAGSPSKELAVSGAASATVSSDKTQFPREKVKRTILISIDSCDADNFVLGRLPRLRSFLEENGFSFTAANTCMAAETMSGHTTMLTGCFPSSSGIIGNGFFDAETGEEIAVVQSAAYRMVPTVFEHLDKVRPNFTTAFISGKWRLPKLLAAGADIVRSSPTVQEQYQGPGVHERGRIGRPAFHFEGDVYDPWTIRTALETIRTADPEFLFLNLAWLDRTGHDAGAFNFNQGRHLRYLDHALMQFIFDLKAFGAYEETMFVFTGDHGMETVKSYFDPQRFLKEEGIAVSHIHSEGHCGFIYLEDPEKDLNRAVRTLSECEEVAAVLPWYALDMLQLDTERNRTGDLFINCGEYTVINFKGLPMIYAGMHGGIQTRPVPLFFLGPGVRRGGKSKNPEVSVADIVPTLFDVWMINSPSHLEGRSLYGTISGR